MSDPTYLSIDRAYWSAAIFAAAEATGARSIRGYVFDHYLEDVGGFCGGWSPAVIAEIYARGYDFGPIFVFRDGEQQPDPGRCVEILQQLGVRQGAWAHDDIEGGAQDRLDHALGLTSALQAASYRSAPYGTPSTLNSGYLQGADGAWVATYLNQDWQPVPPLTSVPWVGAWSWIGWQYANSKQVAGVDVDVSVMNFPVGPGGKGGIVLPPTPFQISVKAGMRWHGNPGEGPIGDPLASDLVAQVGGDEAAHGPAVTGDAQWVRPSGGTWWFASGDVTVLQPPAPANVDLTPVITRLDDMNLQLAAIAKSSAAAQAAAEGALAKVSKDLA